MTWLPKLLMPFTSIVTIPASPESSLPVTVPVMSTVSPAQFGTPRRIEIPRSSAFGPAQSVT